MAGGRFWTSLEYKKLEEMLDTGIKYATIGKRLGRSFGSIHGQSARIRMKRGIVPLPKLHKPGELMDWVKKLCIQGVPDSAVAGILGVTRAAVKYARERAGVPPGCTKGVRQKQPQYANISTRAKVIRLYSGVGRSDREIAKLIGCHYSSIHYIRESIGLPALGHSGKVPSLEATPDKIVRYSSTTTDAAIIALRKVETLSDVEIGGILGMKASAIQRRRKRLGIAAGVKAFHTTSFPQRNSSDK